MTQQTCESFFKSSARSAGARLLSEDRVAFSRPSPTEVTAYVKPNYRVSLKLNQSGNLNVDCNCAPSRKGELCKHIWAGVLAVFAKSPDFFLNVSEVVKTEHAAPALRPLSEEQIKSQADFKVKQDLFRKIQYQKQKLRAQEFKNNKKKSSAAPVFPADVRKALSYFENNGFTLADTLTEEAISLARKKLARIFHPDVGGSHEEGLELNANSEVLLRYLR